jgi:tryptophan synthase alpha chain
MGNRIDSLFVRLKSEGRRALMPFITAGDPDLPTTAALIAELVARGAHLVEIGIPYSDPIADGPVIAASYHRALEGGVKLGHILQTIRTLRAETTAGALGVAPLVTMVSYAIIHRRGADCYLREAAFAGIDGLIVPDLPVEESEGLSRMATALDLRLIQLVTPTTPRARALRIAQATTGFLYYVSVAGITGERKSLPPGLVENVAWLRTQTDLPICIGFGISSAEQVRLRDQFGRAGPHSGPRRRRADRRQRPGAPAGRGAEPATVRGRRRDRPLRGRARLKPRVGQYLNRRLFSKTSSGPQATADVPTSINQLRQKLGRTGLLDSNKITIVRALPGAVPQVPGTTFFGWVTQQSGKLVTDRRGRVIIKLTDEALASLTTAVETAGHELEAIR